jgi:hypothetical protein
VQPKDANLPETFVFIGQKPARNLVVEMRIVSEDGAYDVSRQSAPFRLSYGLTKTTNLQWIKSDTTVNNSVFESIGYYETRHNATAKILQNDSVLGCRAFLLIKVSVDNSRWRKQVKNNKASYIGQG